METNIIHHGRCEDVMKTFPDNSIDSCVCDPPYGIKFMSEKWDYEIPSVASWQELYRVLKPGAHICVFCGDRTYHRMVVNIEDAGFQIKHGICWAYGSGFPKSHSISKQIDKMAGAEREVIGKQEITGQALGSIKGFRGTQGEDQEYKKEWDITAPATDEAKQWEGWGSCGLKPALEMICVAQKPLSEKNIAQNVLKWGTGAVNIDASRIPIDGDDTSRPVHQTQSWKNSSSKGVGSVNDDCKKGRWPANLILQNDPEVLGMFPETKSGTIDPSKHIHKGGKGNALDGSKDGSLNNYLPHQHHEGDSGSAARFFKQIELDEEYDRLFYCAKPSRAERNMGCEGLQAKQQTTPGEGRSYNDRCGNCGKKFIGDEASRCDCDNPITDKTQYKNANNHSTVKPIKLIKYLQTLVTPPDGITIDPYIGSGTGAIAAIQGGFKYIGIEMMEEYVNLARTRVENIKKSGVQVDLF